MAADNKASGGTWVSDSRKLLSLLEERGYLNQQDVAAKLLEAGAYNTKNSAAAHFCAALSGKERLSGKAYQCLQEILGEDSSLAECVMIPASAVRKELTGKESGFSDYLSGITRLYQTAPLAVRHRIIEGLDAIVSSLE